MSSIAKLTKGGGWTIYPNRVWEQDKSGKWTSREKTTADRKRELESFSRVFE